MPRRVQPARTPAARFRLYPDSPRGLYVIVNVWRNQRDLQFFLRDVRNLDRTSTTVANCQGFDVTAFPRNRAPRKRPVFAEVNFSVRRTGTRVFTHELLHATFAWARRLRLNSSKMFVEEVGGHCDDVEERICRAHGNLCRAFVARMYGLGLFS